MKNDWENDPLLDVGEDGKADASEHKGNNDDKDHQVEEGEFEEDLLRNDPTKYEGVRTMRSYIVPERR